MLGLLYNLDGQKTLAACRHQVGHCEEEINSGNMTIRGDADLVTLPLSDVKTWRPLAAPVPLATLLTKTAMSDIPRGLA